ncbi:MAG: hypothetical protein DCC65_07790 [Planctomycetota bacterium]|nr:MAG: hypothetical protein DCC65_07790 [Planctomycetota bacterium]
MDYFRFKKTAVISASLFFQACGGGGGGDDLGLCRSYCESGCAKTANCGFLAQSAVGLCSDSCYQRVRDNGGTNDSCQRAAAVLLTANCNQIGTLLGFRMQTRMDEDEMSSQFETGAALADMIEEEFRQ